MSTDPYAAPSADLDVNDTTVPTSVWSAKGRLSILSFIAQNLLLIVAYSAILFGIMLVIGLVLGGGDIESTFNSNSGGPARIAITISFVLVGLASLWISICLTIKRLHDRNHTGWWSLIMFIPLVNLLLVIYIVLFRGNKHSNRFGAPRPTKGWEKVLGIIGIILLVLTIVAFGAAFLNVGGSGFEEMMRGS